MAPDFSINEAIDLFGYHADTVNVLWNLFQIIALTFISLAFGNKFVRGTSSAKAALSIGFFVFAWGNRVAIGRSQEVLHKLDMAFCSLKSGSLVKEEFLPAINAISAQQPDKLHFFHWLITIIVMLACWTPELRLFINKMVSEYRKSNKANSADAKKKRD